MHDIRAVRDDPEGFDAALARRGVAARAAEILAIDAAWRAGTARLQELQGQRNQKSKEIGCALREGRGAEAIKQEVASINLEIAALQQATAQAEAETREILEALPNLLDPSVPDGADEAANLVLHQHGAIPAFDFAPRQHFELGEALGQMDFEAASRIAGTRFTILRGGLARLERALGQFMLDLHTTEHGYTECSVPGLVNAGAMYGTGQLPKFAEDAFRTTDDRWLIPTAEVPLTNTVAGQIVPQARLTMRLTALTDCFRSEAGSAGRDTRGMLRQHQFRKVEMVSLTAPEDSEAEHERMTRCAEAVLEALELPYRRVLLCAGDTGFSAAKTYDLEVWLPGQGMWREISSCSNCRDFQARRMNARMRAADGKSIRHLHTLNGSGVAIGRALIAVMENHQTRTGAIGVPARLRPYLAGQAFIEAA